MELFYNSTYAQSSRGFRIMRLFSDDMFYDVMSVEEIGKEMFSFFSGNLFRMLWFEKSDPSDESKNSHYVGIKGIKGVFNNGKAGIIDLALILNDDEAALAPYFVNAFINCYRDFSYLIFNRTFIDKNGDYSFDFNGFYEGLINLPIDSLPDYVFSGNKPDSVHTAVMIVTKELAIEWFNNYKLKFSKKYMIEEKHFEKYIS